MAENWVMAAQLSRRDFIDAGEWRIKVSQTQEEVNRRAHGRPCRMVDEANGSLTFWIQLTPGETELPPLEPPAADPGVIEHKGSTYRVEFFKQRTRYPAERLLIEIGGELIDMGWSETMPGDWNDKVIALVDVDHNIVVAALSYVYQEWRREVFVTLGGVDTNWRRMGLYRVLWTAFVDHARETYPDATAIVSGYHADNRASAAMHKALGRPVTHHLTTFNLAEGTDAER